jgi:beta-xylosidase
VLHKYNEFLVLDICNNQMKNHTSRLFLRLISLSLVALACAFASTTTVNAHDNTFRNPILRGGYPDPSICRVGDNYYVVNSSFEYFPGLPIHHSKDLVNWELIGYGLHRKEQASTAVNLVDVQSNGGIHAPTLRCRNGMFYIITTNVYCPRHAYCRLPASESRMFSEISTWTTYTESLVC